MAGDTKVSLEGVGTDVYSTLKIFNINGALYGCHGEDTSGQIRGIEWLQTGMIRENRPDPPDDADWHILELSKSGLAIYNDWMERDPLLDKCIAIGSGRKVALYCMRYLKMSPAEAVAEACKVDDFSDRPVYVASLENPTPRLWTPKKKRKQ